MQVRTDRVLPFYEGDDNANVTLLRDILVTYSFYNFDLGYCQVSIGQGFVSRQFERILSTLDDL